MSDDTKDRIWMYSIWGGWGAAPVLFIWTDAIPFSGAVLFWAWCIYFLVATYVTKRWCRPSAVKPILPKPDTEPESG